jgi:hypothetical protein
MRRKWIQLCALAAVGMLALTSLTVFVLTSTKPGVTDQNFESITYGMTLAEVQRLMGSEGQERESNGINTIRSWSDNGLTLDVSFQGGRVWQRARMKDGRGWSEVPPERLLARLFR